MITININYCRRPFGVEQEYFIQLFFEIDPNNTEVPKTDKLLTQMFHEQQISFTRVSGSIMCLYTDCTT